MVERSPEGTARWLAAMLTVSGIVVASVILRVWPGALSAPTLNVVVGTQAGGASFTIDDPADGGVVALSRVDRALGRPSVLPSGGARLVTPVSARGETHPAPEEPPQIMAGALLVGTSFATAVTAAPAVLHPVLPDDIDAAPSAVPASTPHPGAVARALVSAGRGAATGLRAAGAGIRAAF